MGESSYGDIRRQELSMIGCKTKLNGNPYSLIDYGRRKDPRLPSLWQQIGFEPVGQTKALLVIDDFVDRVLSSSQPAFTVRQSGSGLISVSQTNLGARLVSLLPTVGLFDSRHDYSEKPYAFLDACWLTENLRRIDLPVIGANPIFAELYHYDAMNEIVDKIRVSAQQEWFRRAVSDRKYESKERAKKIAEYVAKLLSYYSRLLLVRVDFYYPEEVRHQVDIDRLYRDVGRIRYMMGRHPYFEHLKGYVWVIEEGKRKGPHAHFLFLFDGSKVRKDMMLSNLIRGLWDDNIAKNYGASFSSNLQKERFQDVGIGMIHRSDSNACRNAVHFATYLAKDPHREGVVKDPQYLRMAPMNRRSFGTGALRIPDVRVGRTPVNLPKWSIEEMRGLRWPN